nr:phosphoglucan, water dikinase, chloroplastic [Ipomoea batatas]
MKALTGSPSLKVGCLEKERWKLFWSQRPEICFLGLPGGRRSGKFSCLSTFERKNIRPIFAASSDLSSSASNSQTEFQCEEMESTSTDDFKTARVKFQLQRQCSFGQHFWVVGDDPILGSWDPSNAVPLTWSDGHVWTVEMDFPCGKSINYKFILKGAGNAILWQPGPDRVLDVWETSNTVTVCEDWDNIELRKIMEEELLAGERGESPTDTEVLIAENSTRERIDTDANANANEPVQIVAENITGADEDVNASNASGSTSNDATYIEETVTSGPTDFGKSGTAVHGGNLSSKGEARLDFDEGLPILVPGLHQVLSVETEAMPSNEIQVETVAENSLGSSEAEDFKLQEERLELDSKEDFQTESSNDEETSEMKTTDISGIVHQLDSKEDFQTDSSNDEETSEMKTTDISGIVHQLDSKEDFQTDSSNDEETSEMKTTDISGIVHQLDSKEEFQTDSSNDKETSEMMLTGINGVEDNGHVQEPESEELQEYQCDTQQLETRVNESDLQWGRQTIKKILTNFGWL